MATATPEAPPDHSEHQGRKTFAATLAFIVLATACLIPLGVSFIFWAPLAVAIAVASWIGATRRPRNPPDAYQRDDRPPFRAPPPPGGGRTPPASSP